MFKHTMIWAAAAIATTAMGCDNGTTANPQSTPATTPAPAAPPATVTNTNAIEAVDPLALVANRADLTTDPNAIKIDPPKSAVLVTGVATTVRQSPRGSMIKVIETTSTVKEVERDGNYFLVTFPDPKGSAQTFAGWVYRDSLVGEGPTVAAPGTARATGKLACATGESHLRTTQDFCGKTCADDHDCDSSKGQICDGIGFKINEKTDAHTDARYCISDTASGANTLHGSEHGPSSNLPVR
jgi:hypothetical protein